jgi:hypothetical protein
VSGFRSDAPFARAVAQLPITDPAFSELVQRCEKAPTFYAAVSVFVSGAVAGGILVDVINGVLQVAAWQREFYRLGSIIRYTMLLEQVREFLVQLTATERDDLLADLCCDDERRYIKNLPFEFFLVSDPRVPVTLDSLVRQLENGMTYDGLFLTKGPWAVISAVARSGTASAEFASTFREVDELSVVDPQRRFASKLEDFLQRGIESGRIARWVAEIASYREFIEPLYECDATIRDDVRVHILVNALAR